MGKSSGVGVGGFGVGVGGFGVGVGGFGVLAQLCMTAAYKQGKTLVSASLAYSTVIFSSVFGMLLWDENLPWQAWVGVVLIIGAGLLATMLSRRTAVGSPDA